jgi:hypothetical protein
VFLGCPVEYFGVSTATKKWLDTNVKDKKIGLFCTHGAPEFAPNVPQWLEAVKSAAKDAGAEIFAFFNCQGELSQNVLDMMLKAEDPTVRALASFGRDETIGQPDESRIEKAKEFARDTIRRLENS